MQDPNLDLGLSELYCHRTHVLKGCEMGIGKKAKSAGEIIKGKTKETAGKALGNETLEGKGRAEKTKGKVRHVVEKGKDKLRH
ncbi:CsbD family protein [Streptomyces sp. NPDC039016]|uniref:CsbD family protein n=1 Tax=Streptomyces sp. NPDC039016 TaxID=3154330 RepID=UPI0033F0594F